MEVAHSPSQVLGRQIQLHVVPGLQQDGLGLTQPLTDGPIGGLPEVAALGVL